MRKRESVFGSLAVLGAFVGGCGLILLSIFDTRRHSSLHRAFLLLFIVGVALSAIFTIVEVGMLAKRVPFITEFSQIRHLSSVGSAETLLMSERSRPHIFPRES